MRTITTSPALLHPPLVGAGTSLLIAAFASDLFYWRTLLFQWNNISIWLLTAGLIVAAVAALALFAEVLLGLAGHLAWERFAGFAAAVLLSILNAFVHSRDAYTAVVPDGIGLSASVAIILVALGRRGWAISQGVRP